MDAERDIQNIALTGFMGCGKTAVGRVVARVSGFEFLDTDLFIEEHVGMSIPRIFEEHGEETFRRYCLLYTSPSPRDKRQSRMPSSA